MHEARHQGTLFISNFFMDNRVLLENTRPLKSSLPSSKVKLHLEMAFKANARENLSLSFFQRLLAAELETAFKGENII